MFDLPEPLGPTITLTPGENSSLVRPGNDLNPFISIDLKYISRPRSERLAGESDETCPAIPPGASAPPRPPSAPRPSCYGRRRFPRSHRPRWPPPRRSAGALGPIRRSRRRLRALGGARAAPEAPTSHLPALRRRARPDPRRLRQPPTRRDRTR